MSLHDRIRPILGHAASNVSGPVREASITVDVTKVSPKMAAVEASLPEELRPVFRRLVEDYRLAAFGVTRSAFVSFDVLAALVRKGWRGPGEVRT